MITGRLAGRSPSLRARRASAGGAISSPRSRPSGPDGLGIGRLVCTSSGSTRCARPCAGSRACTELDQLCCSTREHRRVQRATSAERGAEIDLLERPRSEDLRRRPGRSSRSLARGRPWRPTARSAGWSSRGRRSSRQAAGRPVSLPYADAANAAAPSWRIPMYPSSPRLLGAPQRVGEAEVRVTDHAEHVASRPTRPRSRP